MQNILNFKQAILKLLVPLVKFCLKYSISYQQVEEVLKEAFIIASKDEINLQAGKATVSSLHIRTGIPRREIKKILSGKPSTNLHLGIIPRILGQWQSNSAFSSKDGPKPLTYLDSDSEFYNLCSLVTKDVPAGSILSDLLRLKYVEVEAPYLKLKAGAHETKENLPQAIGDLAIELDNLIKVVEHNSALSGSNLPKYHHAVTSYNNIRADKISEILDWLYKEGSRFHELLRCYLAPYDLDINPDKNYAGESRTVSFSSVASTK